ncbi:hypothetical protein KBD81_05280 [Candidatus Woesebacteria bacterium]|nr:hypothetical protein [Candidatus Woesebacteria bacterium]
MPPVLETAAQQPTDDIPKHEIHMVNPNAFALRRFAAEKERSQKYMQQALEGGRESEAPQETRLWREAGPSFPPPASINVHGVTIHAHPGEMVFDILTREPALSGAVVFMAHLESVKDEI